VVFSGGKNKKNMSYFKEDKCALYKCTKEKRIAALESKLK